MTFKWLKLQSHGGSGLSQGLTAGLPRKAEGHQTLQEPAGTQNNPGAGRPLVEAILKTLPPGLSEFKEAAPLCPSAKQKKWFRRHKARDKTGRFSENLKYSTTTERGDCGRLTAEVVAQGWGVLHRIFKSFIPPCAWDTQ